MDFSVITPRLLTGAAITDATDVEVLVAAGVTHVIDCRGEFDDAPLLGAAFTYLWNGTDDDGQPKPPEWFGKSISFALPALAQPHVRVYTHCAAGQNRGPSTCYAIMRALGFASTDALELIHAGRPVTQGHVRYAADADRAITTLGFD